MKEDFAIISEKLLLGIFIFYFNALFR